MPATSCHGHVEVGYKNGHVGRSNIKQTVNCKFEKQSQFIQDTVSIMAFNNLLFCAVLATAIYCATAAPTTAIYKLLSERSGLFVEALANGDVHATASAMGKCIPAAVHMHACDKIITFGAKVIY